MGRARSLPVVSVFVCVFPSFFAPVLLQPIAPLWCRCSSRPVSSANHALRAPGPVQAQLGSSPDSRADFKRCFIVLLCLSLFCAPQTIATC